MSSSSQPLTLLLRKWGEGDESALRELTPLVYDELRRLADSYLRRERPDHTLQPTALIHEAYLRLVEQSQAFNSRKHFYGVAAHLMRNILVDHARARRAERRGGGGEKIPLEAAHLFSYQRDWDLLALDEALGRLAAFDERKSRAVELHYFGGLGVEDAADVLDISVATFRRDIRFAENWLYRELKRSS